MTDCAAIRPDLAAWIAGELPPLVAARVEAHVARCDACNDVVEALARGLAAARAPIDVPANAVEDAVAAVLARAGAAAAPLAPTKVELDTARTDTAALSSVARRPRRPPRLSVIAATTAASLVAATVAVALLVERRALDDVAAARSAVTSFAPSTSASSSTSPGVTASSTPTAARTTAGANAAADDEAPGEDATPVEKAALVAADPAPGLRMLSQPTWQGRVERDGDTTVVVVEGGFAAFAFAGEGRLLVRTRAVDVIVLGTRFVVDVREGVTMVGVASGRVTLAGADGTRELAAGSAVRYVDGAPIMRALDADLAAILDDEALRVFEARKVTRAKTRSPSGDAVACAAEAQRAAGAGDAEGAVARYRRCIDDAPAALRDVLRYELARLEVFSLGRPTAREAFTALTRSADREVARQAALSLCELDAQRDACAAHTCLTALGRGRDVVLADSARRLAAKWRVAERCGR